jgi:hypothetical protein
MALHRHLELCIDALAEYGRITEFDRMRALRNFPDLQHRTDAAALREALDRLTVPPCLFPAPSPRHWKERRALARWLLAQGFCNGRVLHLP